MEAALIWKQKHEIMHISTSPWALIISANLHAQTLPLVRFGHVGYQRLLGWTEAP